MKNIEQQIQNKLDDLQQQKGCRLLLAVESGSRAWGFASPDSDYDVRFIYVRPQEAYLRLNQLRDVIDNCVEGELCENCRSVIEKEMGALLYYTAGLCNTLDLSMYDAILREEKRLTTLGRFSLR